MTDLIQSSICALACKEAKNASAFARLGKQLLVNPKTRMGRIPVTGAII